MENENQTKQDSGLPSRPLIGSAARDLLLASELVSLIYPLPRCKHKNALRDHSGAKLYPSCGCQR